ncbi:VOC family protein [Aeromicrobium sp. NPDC092404]|uniref:VOC family protein n=1 Tax=Aeromicrobium sp. NPDC092404 TaxID=3154976 RepID=UPI003430C316
MATLLNPYISFRDTAREAMDFYQSVLGGEVKRNTFAEFQVSEDPAEADKIMHSQLETPGGLTLMAADVPNGQDHSVGDNIAISLSGEDESELRGYFEGLSAGGTVQVPFEQAPWGDMFGMFTDKFGIPWMVNGVAPEA